MRNISLFAFLFTSLTIAACGGQDMITKVDEPQARPPSSIYLPDIKITQTTTIVNTSTTIVYTSTIVNVYTSTTVVSGCVGNLRVCGPNTACDPVTDTCVGATMTATTGCSRDPSVCGRDSECDISSDTCVGVTRTSTVPVGCNTNPSICGPGTFCNQQANQCFPPPATGACLLNSTLTAVAAGNVDAPPGLPAYAYVHFIGGSAQDSEVRMLSVMGAGVNIPTLDCFSLIDEFGSVIQHACGYSLPARTPSVWFTFSNLNIRVPAGGEIYIGIGFTYHVTAAHAEDTYVGLLGMQAQGLTDRCDLGWTGGVYQMFTTL